MCEKTRWKMYIYIYIISVSVLLAISYIFYPSDMGFLSTIVKTILRVGIYMFIVVGLHQIILDIRN